MIFPHSSAELIKNTSLVVGTTVMDALNSLTTAQGISAAWQAILAQAAPTGVYTPTFTNGANVAASTAYSGRFWFRFSDLVFVPSLFFDVDPTAAAGTATTIAISLPVASNFTNAAQCIGGVSASNVALEAVGVTGDSTNDRATMTWFSQTTANHNMVGWMAYQVV